MTTTLNTYPYYDDFDEDKNFAKVLFVPGRSVQARELTQLQTILQEQIARHGRHMFKNGTMILPGHIFYDNATEYVKIAPKNGDGVLVDSFLDTLVGMTIVGATSGVTATIIHVVKSTSSTPPTLYVRYMKAGESTQQTKFASNETLSVTGLANTTMITETSATFKGLGSLCNINEGVYFINGYFVKVQKQTVVLDMYGTTPSKKVGLEYKETIVTEKDDETLYDNAIGFSNYTAPGAHRLKIELNLTSKDFDFNLVDAEAESDTELKFIDLLQVRDGVILFKANETKYAEFERLLARRTADESGDYVVKPFNSQINEYRSNVRGAWATGVVYLRGDVVSNGGKYYTARNDGVAGATAPTHANGVKTDGNINWTQTSTINDNKGIFKPLATDSLTANIAGTEKLVATLSDGKAYINGFEVRKGANSLYTINKARTSKFVNSSQILAPKGSYVVADVTGVPNISTVEQLEIRDVTNTQIGTCRVRNIKAAPIPTALTRSNVYIFDVRMNTDKNFALHAKTLFNASCTATIVKQKSRLNGTANILGGSLNTLSGLNTNFLLELQVGATVYVNNGTSPEVRTIATITSDTTATVGVNMTAANGVTVDVEYVELFEAGANISKLPNDFIKSLRDPNGGLAIDTQYVVSKYSTIANGTIVATTGEVFMQTGHILSQGVVDSVAVDGSSIDVSGITGSKPALLVVKRKNEAAKEKRKTLSTKTVYLFSGGVYDGDNTGTATLITASTRLGQGRTVSLTEADVIQITSVTKSGDSNPSATTYTASNEVDITNKFSLNNGQTDDYYGVATASTSEIPNRVLKITFDYFEHSTGDYFSVDSYSDVKYEDIPDYKTSDGTVLELRDCLDFRPRMADNGADFSSTGAVVGSPVIDTEYVVFDYSYYLPRSDKLVIASTGDVKIIEGTPSDTPSLPATPTETLDLFNISLSAYTVSAAKDAVKVNQIAHRRYTMKDIGSLDKRISNVEEYVALTLEEKDTADLKIVDQYGLERFKNGFFVDPFKDFTLADRDAADLRCSVDPTPQELRPNFVRKNTRLMEREGTTEAFRSSNNYRVTGNIASLDYEEVPLITQRVASRGEFINPFNVVSFEGATTLYPNSDTWVEIEDNLDQTAANAARRRVGENWTVGWARWWVWNPNLRTWRWNWDEEGNVWEDTGAWQRADFRLTRTITGVNTRSDLVRTEISNNAVALVRGKKIVVTVTGMKPFSQINTYINGENQDEVTSPLQMVTLGAVTPTTGKFIGFGNSIMTDRQSTRIVDDSWTDPTFRLPAVKNSHIISYGEVLSFKDVNGVEKATALCVKHGSIRVGSSDVAMIRVVNFVGTMTGVVSVLGTTSGVSAVLSGGALTSVGSVADSLGNFYAMVTLPHRKFRTGVLDFEFMDVAVHDRALSTCHSAGSYVATGNLQRNFFQETVVSFNTTDNWQFNNWVWGDPLTQSFMIPESASNGTFVTSVDLFFQIKPVGETLPVQVMICEMENGYPAKRILVNATANLEASEIVADAKTMVATRAKFAGPVYLRPGVEYGIKILSNSNGYKLWIARMGDVRIDLPTAVVTSQPHTGSLFKSQNNSTWTAEQMEDLAFVLNRAKFDITQSGVVSIVNAGNSETFLPPDPIGLVNGQTKAKINHPGHGFQNGQKVTFANSGIDGEYTVSDAREGTYFITLGAAATVTDNVGGLSVLVTQNTKYDVMQLAIDTFAPNDTVVNSTFAGVTAAGIETTAVNLPLGQVIEMPETRYVYDTRNEDLSLSKEKSVRVTLGLSSTDDYVSPLVVFDSMMLDMSSNVIDNVTSATINVANSKDIETITTGSTQFFLATNSFVVTTNISAFITGAYVTIAGANAGNNSATPVKILRVDASDNRVYLDFDLTVDETVATPTIKQYIAYVDEISQSNGTAASKYISQQVRLDSISTALKVMFAANIPNDAEIDLYYRTGVNDISKVIWTKIPTAYKKSVSTREFIDQEYDLDNLVGFNTYQFKLVMRSSNGAAVPKIKSLRGIALA